MILRGKEAIAEYCRDVFGRDMTHRIESEVVEADRAAFDWACEYANGTKVLAAAPVGLPERLEQELRLRMPLSSLGSFC